MTCCVLHTPEYKTQACSFGRFKVAMDSTFLIADVFRYCFQTLRVKRMERVFSETSNKRVSGNLRVLCVEFHAGGRIQCGGRSAKINSSQFKSR